MITDGIAMQLIEAIVAEGTKAVLSYPVVLRSRASEPRAVLLRRSVRASRLEAISKTPFGLREGLSRPCFVVKGLTELPAMLGFQASPGREIPLARFQ